MSHFSYSSNKPMRSINTILAVTIFLLIIIQPSYLHIQELEFSNNGIPSTDQDFVHTIFGRSSENSNTNYTYHNYSTLVTDLEYLSDTYPNLIELTTAQDQFGLADCSGGYKIWIIRITNESSGFNKPEIFFVGGHHGNEPISIEAPYYLIEYLLENYNNNSYIRSLIDNREIYIMPVINPWGWENDIREDPNGEDVNRDYPYATQAGNIPLTTIGATAVTELMKQHQFIISLSWHSGDHLIYYAWGTPIHDTLNDESPDNIAYFEVAKLMSDFAGGETNYKYGPANQLFYFGGVRGAWSDYAYAASWDTDHLLSGFDTNGSRSLAFGVEISNNKKPDESKLGNPGNVWEPIGVIKGFIPQNIRMALVLIDLVEPSVDWHNNETSKIPLQVDTGGELNLSWYVNGSFSVSNTRISFGRDPDPINNPEYVTDSQSGSNNLIDAKFNETIKIPEIPGDYYFMAHAQVDQISLVQNTPEPDLSPQSFYVKQRTDPNWNETNNGNTISGRKDWFSNIVLIKVKGEFKNQIKITNYDTEVYCNEKFNVSWLVNTDGALNHTELYWGRNNDPINQSSHISENLTGNAGTFYSNITLPSKPGKYYFVAHFVITPNSSKTAGKITNFWSNIISIEVFPRAPYKLAVDIGGLAYKNSFQQTLEIVKINCYNNTISNQSLDADLMINHTLIIQKYISDGIDDIGNGYYEYDLEWSLEHEYWFLPKVNISFLKNGWYSIICKFTHRYGIGESVRVYSMDKNNLFKVQHEMIIKKPNVRVVKNVPDYLEISNVTVRSSNKLSGYTGDDKLSEYSYHVHNTSSGVELLNGTLYWSMVNQSWWVIDTNLENLSPGSYFVICTFEIDGFGRISSIHVQGDSTEFIIKQQNEDETQNTDESGFQFVIIMVIIIIIIFIIGSIASILVYKKGLKNRKKK